MEIALYNQINNPIDAIDKLGEWFAKSGMTGADNSNAGKVLAWECLAQRKSPSEILRKYDIIGGKLRDKALSIYAAFRAKGGKVRWIKTGDDHQEASAEFTFEGQTLTGRFTLEQAKAQGLVKPNSGWAKTPANMLRARVLSNTIAMLCPEIVAGDDLDDAVEASAPEIKLPAASTAHTTAVPAVTVEAEVVPIRVATMAESLPTPALAPQVPPTAPAPVQHVAGVPLLPEETVAKLQDAIGNQAVAAGKWLIAQGWLQSGQGLQHLSENRANRILKQTASFIRAVTGGAA